MVVRAALPRGRLGSIPSAIGQSLASPVSQSHASYSGHRPKSCISHISISRRAPPSHPSPASKKMPRRVVWKREGGREGGRGPKAPLGSRWQLALLHPVVFPVGSRARLARFPVLSALRHLSRRHPRLVTSRLVCASSRLSSLVPLLSSKERERCWLAGNRWPTLLPRHVLPGAYPLRAVSSVLSAR